MRKLSFNQIIAIIVVVFSMIGLYSSFVLTIEKIISLKTGTQPLNCDLNSVISCSTVMKSPQAEIYGIPNPLFGIVGYSIMLTFGSILFFGILHKRLFLLANLGAFGAFVFSYWLLYQSVFSIGAMCPYCIMSCISSTNIFFGLSIYNCKENHIHLPDKLISPIQRYIDKHYYAYFIGSWYFLVFFIIFMKYREAFI